MARWLRWAPAAPFGGVVVLYVLYRQVYDLVGIERVELSVPVGAWGSLAGPGEVVANFGARLTWGVAVLAFSLAFLFTLAVCLRVVWAGSSGKARVALLAGSLASAGVGVAVGLAGNPLTLPQLVDLLLEGFRRMGVDAGPFLLYFLNGLAIAVLALLTFAASTTLLPASSGSVDSAESTATEHLKEQARRLRQVLYSGAAVLLAGSAQSAAMHRLPIAYLQEPWPEALESVAQLAAVSTGALWSLFLVSIYLPAALILRAAFTAEAKRALPKAGEKERETWLVAHGLNLSVAQQLKHLAALLGPFLGSLPLTGLFELLGT